MTPKEFQNLSPQEQIDIWASLSESDQKAIREAPKAGVETKEVTISQNDKTMDQITRYEWHGSYIILFILFFSGFLIPVGFVYLITNTLAITEGVKDASKLSAFLSKR